MIAAGDSGSTARRALAPERRRVSASSSVRICAASPAMSPAGQTSPASLSSSELRGAGFRAGDHGKLAGHRLERRFRRGIVERRQHERVGRAVPASRVRARDRRS